MGDWGYSVNKMADAKFRRRSRALHYILARANL